MIECISQRQYHPIGIYTTLNLSKFPVVIIDFSSKISILKKSGKTFHFQFLRSVCQTIIAQIGHFQCTGEIVRNTNFARFRSNSSNYHYTVSGTRTVNSRSGSIFKDSHTLYTARIQVIYLFNANLKSIHNKCRKIRIILQIRFRQLILVQISDTYPRTSANIHFRQRIRIGAKLRISHQAERRIKRLHGVKYIRL